MSDVMINTKDGYAEIYVKECVPVQKVPLTSRVAIISQSSVREADFPDIVEVGPDQLDALIVALQDIQAKIAAQEAHKKWLHTAEPGAQYRHKKGGIYVVKEFTRDADTGLDRVSYYNPHTPYPVHSRRREEFEDGRFTREEK